MVNLDRLEELARAATPDPWQWWDNRGTVCTTPVQDRETGEWKAVPTGVVLTGNFHQGVRMSDGHLLSGAPEDMQYIAAASPDVVLKLIAVARAAQPLMQVGYDDGPEEEALAAALAALRETTA